YPDVAWGTPWRDMITADATGMGRAEDGAVLIAELEGEIEEAVAKHPAIAGKYVMFLTHVDTTDLSTVNFYTAHDTRTMFFEDLAEDGAVLLAVLKGEIDEAVSMHPAIAGKSLMFLPHVDSTDLSTVNFFTAHDTRTMFFEDLGMTIAQSVQDASAETEEFSS